MLSKKSQKGHKILTFTHTGLCAPNADANTEVSATVPPLKSARGCRVCKEQNSQ